MTRWRAFGILSIGLLGVGGASVVRGVVSARSPGDAVGARPASVGEPEAGDRAPVVAARTVDRLLLFRTGNGGDQLALDGEELTALLRHGLPGMVPEGVLKPTIRLEGGRVQAEAWVATEEWSGASHLNLVLAVLPDTVAIELAGTLARGSGRLVFLIDQARANGVPIPRAVLGRMVTAMPLGGGQGAMTTRRGGDSVQPAFRVSWPRGIGSITVEGDQLLLAPAEPILERAVDGGGGA